MSDLPTFIGGPVQLQDHGSASIPSLLPPNATDAGRALEQAFAARLLAIDTPVDRLWNPATCPLPLLPWLAWAFAVEVWDSTWPEARKRQVVAASLAVHRRKGTRGALVQALAAVDHPTEVVEWWESPPALASSGDGPQPGGPLGQPRQGDPFTFRVRVDVASGAELVELRAIAALIETAKNLRSYLTGLELTLRPACALHVGCAGRARVRVRLPAAA